MKTIVCTFLSLVCCQGFALGEIPDSLWTLQRVSNATPLLFQQVTDTSGRIGSATLLGHNSHFYLLTATHVAKQMSNTAKLVFRLDGDKPLAVDLIHLARSGSLSWKHHPVADVSIIELNPPSGEIRDRVTQCAFPIRQIHFGKDLPEREADLTFLGFPALDLRMEFFSPLNFTGYLSSGLITRPRADTNTPCTFFYLNVPSIQGCSGSGVYYSVKKAMYYGMNKTIMVGIMHGTLSDDTGGKMAAVTPSYYIFDLFEE